MFTFGIFTTHLPYIAFVFFYIYLLFFDTHNIPHNDQLRAESHSQITEKQQLNFKITKSCFHYADLLIITKRKASEKISSDKKIEKPSIPCISYYHSHFSLSLANRPPPIA